MMQQILASASDTNAPSWAHLAWEFLEASSEKNPTNRICHLRSDGPKQKQRKLCRLFVAFFLFCSPPNRRAQTLSLASLGALRNNEASDWGVWPAVSTLQVRLERRSNECSERNRAQFQELAFFFLLTCPKSLDPYTIVFLPIGKIDMAIRRNPM